MGRCDRDGDVDGAGLLLEVRRSVAQEEGLRAGGGGEAGGESAGDDGGGGGRDVEAARVAGLSL